MIIIAWQSLQVILITAKESCLNILNPDIALITSVFKIMLSAKTLYKIIQIKGAKINIGVDDFKSNRTRYLYKFNDRRI